MEEIWLQVVEFPNHYEVSNLGRLRRSNDTGRSTYAGRILRTHPTRRGYLSAMFTVGSKRYPRRVSRVVAEAFFGPIGRDLVVNHKNGDVTDNRVENLEIVTQSENMRHAYDVLGFKSARGEHQHLAKLTETAVRFILAMAKDGHSHQQIADAHGVTKQAITAILTGKTWRHVTCLSPAPKRAPNKLTEQQAKETLRLRSVGWTQQAVSDHFGVSKGTINDLCNGRTWKHLTA